MSGKKGRSWKVMTSTEFDYIKSLFNHGLRLSQVQLVTKRSYNVCKDAQGSTNFKEYQKRVGERFQKYNQVKNEIKKSTLVFKTPEKVQEDNKLDLTKVQNSLLTSILAEMKTINDNFAKATIKKEFKLW